MSKPIIAGIKPQQVPLTADKSTAYCPCGRSKSPALCDGSHKETSFKPLIFSVEKDEIAFLCTCKHTKNPPYCDGSHKQFKAEQIGQEGPGV